MKKSTSARRVSRKVGAEEDDGPANGIAEDSGPTLQRQTVKPRKSGVLRKSLGPSAAFHDDDEPSGVVTPKRGSLSKIASQRNAALRTSALPRKRSHEEDEERPSYTTASLQELKDSTPSTPQDLASGTEDAALQDVSEATRGLDLSSKFGSSLARYQAQQLSSAIPSAAEIAEKKARRARLAQEDKADEYISLDPDDPNLDNDGGDDDNVMIDVNGRLVLKPKDKWNESESRLIKDDEDILENFEDFTEDGKIHLGRNAEREAEKKRRREMADQIAAAEGSDADESDSDASERERNAAFEAAQTRHGTYGSTHDAVKADPYAHLRPKTPPMTSLLPTLDGVLDRLRKQLNDMQTSRAQKLQEMQMLKKEKIRLAEEEVRIQKALKETAEKFDGLMRKKGIVGTGGTGVAAPGGLLTAGEANRVVTGDADHVGVNGDNEQNAGEGNDQDGKSGNEDENEVEEVQEAPASHMGLGFAGMSTAPGLGMGMGRPPAAEDDW
ncbi:hypothetical protein LTR78_004380 [Recurvomyces mirabilis]|uniref:Uncharacterized protein n=1 Tax=Recurvomyces mirabilis TaxID=574656 RepID=A0AAE0WQ08_9PEZI|nr:hypothetical protein LTR78_004380 [Recurvomyces mirabilis]KAK5155954.1 hypothetical protein LTS14_005520 [Recurvomyces mirabilis]